MSLEPGQHIGKYEILFKLGSGGMGEVYKARDLKLGRDVAIKVLPHEMVADAGILRRFEQEARAASALNHPNIVTIYEIGEHEGTPYIAMELVQGVTLREKLASGPLPNDELIRYATQLAEGLAKAHQAGIVHRDLKPNNIIISEDGYPKILDFGLAKLSALGQFGSEVTTAVNEGTTPGTILGTIGYMSPEQAKGETTDHRSDQFSLGTILYEMASGKRAFDASTTAECLAAVLKEEPDFKAVAGCLTPVLTKCLKKKPAERWESTEALLAALRAVGVSSTAADASVRSVAVLPFENMSGDCDQSYFSDGITEDIITDLSKVSSIFVVARNSSFTYKGRAVKIQEICTDLNVRYVVEGSVRKSGNKVRITAQLVDGTTGGHLWADRYDGTLEDIFELQDEVTCQIVDALKIRLLPEEREAIQNVPTANVEAYNFYLKGRQHFHYFTEDHLRKAKHYFNRAIACDETYAQSYCGLAECGSFLNVSHGAGHTELVDAMVAAAKAIELAPNLADGHASLGLVLSATGDYSGAKKEFGVAVRLNPNLYEAHYYWGRSCFAEGKLEEAAEHFETAWERSPKDPQTPSLLLQIYRSLGRQADLEHAARETVKIGLQRLETEPENWRSCLSTAFGLVNLGQFSDATVFLERALAKNADDAQVNYNAACLYCHMGDIEKGIQHLEISLKHGSGTEFAGWIENDSDLDPLRDDTRFQELLDRYL